MEDRGTAVPGAESQDLVTVADNLSREILGIPRIANAKSTPRIVIEPVANHTRVAVDGAAFLARVRILLNQRAMSRARFLDRAMLAALERDQTPPKPVRPAAADPSIVEFRGADYFLSGAFDPLGPKTGSGASAAVVCSFRLRDAHTNALVWQGSYEMGEDDLASLLALAL